MARRLAAGIVLSSIIGALLTVAAAPAGAGGGCSDPVTDRRVAQVDAKDFCFFPSVVRVGVNQTVLFTNRDSAEHTVSGAGHGWGDDLALQGSSVTVRFPAPGIYPYYCHLHIGMIGVVVVGTGLPTVSTASMTPLVVSRVTGETTTTEAPTVTTTAAAAANPATSLASRSTSPHRGRNLAVDLAIGAPLVAGAYAVGRIRRPRKSRA